MRGKIRALAVAAALPITLAISATTAFASYEYELPGNGYVHYATSSNNFGVTDMKDGNVLYVRYAFTGAACGSVGNACAPSTYSTHVLAYGYDGYQEIWGTSPTARYVVFKLCQDDAPPDTCSEWKRSAA